MLERLTRLANLAEAQLAAARRLDHARVSALAEERADLVFELRCAATEPELLTDEVRAALRDQLIRLRAIDARLAGVARIVLDGLRPWSPFGSAATYGPAGRLG
jgi:hypothetical protein